MSVILHAHIERKGKVTSDHWLCVVLLYLFMQIGGSTEATGDSQPDLALWSECVNKVYSKWDAATRRRGHWDPLCWESRAIKCSRLYSSVRSEFSLICFTCCQKFCLSKFCLSGSLGFCLVSLCVCLSMCVCFCHCPSLSLPVCLSLSVFLYVSLSVSMCVSVSALLFSQSLSLSPRPLSRLFLE